MRSIFFLVSLIFLITFNSCQKELTISLKSSSNNSFVDSAVAFLKVNLSNDDFAKLDLSSSVPLIYYKTYIGLKISEKGGEGDNFILLKKYKETFMGNRVSLINKKSLASNAHKGEIILETLDRKSNTLLTVTNNEVVHIKQTNNGALSNKGKNSIAIQNRAEKYELPEVVVISVVNHGNEVIYWSLYSLYNDSGGGMGLYTTLINEGNSGGSGYSNDEEPVDNVIATAMFRAPKKPVVNVKDEVKCFTAISSSTYRIRVNVNQPYPETRVLINAFSEFKVGHTFLTLEQINADGTSIVRNLGFYPQNGVKPGSTVDKSSYGDDSDTPFDVSLQIMVSSADFLTVVNTVASNNTDYDLNDFNCTNAAISALSSININLPATSAVGPVFDGNDPADLGEDIRSLNLDQFSAENGSRLMIRTAGEANDQKPPKRNGGC